MNELNAHIKLVNEKVRFSAVSDANPGRPLTLDYVPPVGDGQGFAGLELLLLSFCGCVSTAVVALLRRSGNVAGYEARATGIRQENPLTLKKIVFSVKVFSGDIQASDVEKALAVASAISPVWLAVKGNVEVETDFSLVAP
jgi:putative redox protein